jgi:phosphatidylethanolamine/phosphatidyl-N-methylethanolamine N-methyltransferase
VTGAVRPADRERKAAREHYNRVAMLYDLVEILDERTFRPWRQKLLALAGGRVLEVGVGTGKNFPYYPSGVSLTGIDIAEKMLAAARQRARRLGLAVELHLADVQALEFRRGVFDTAVSTFVFCSVPDPVRGLCELGRVVKGEGKILLLEHVSKQSEAPGPLMGMLGSVITRLMGPKITNHLTLECVLQAGLRIESLDHLGKDHDVKMIVAGPARR